MFQTAHWPILLRTGVSLSSRSRGGRSSEREPSIGRLLLYGELAQIDDLGQLLRCRPGVRSHDHYGRSAGLSGLDARVGVLEDDGVAWVDAQASCCGEVALRKGLPSLMSSSLTT